VVEKDAVSGVEVGLDEEGLGPTEERRGRCRRRRKK
jgi:hypothetical protein